MVSEIFLQFDSGRPIFEARFPGLMLNSLVCLTLPVLMIDAYNIFSFRQLANQKWPIHLEMWQTLLYIKCCKLGREHDRIDVAFDIYREQSITN